MIDGGQSHGVSDGSGRRCLFRHERSLFGQVYHAYESSGKSPRKRRGDTKRMILRRVEVLWSLVVSYVERAKSRLRDEKKVAKRS